MVEMVAGPVSSGMARGTTAMLAPASGALTVPPSGGLAFSMLRALISSKVPPPTWKLAIEMLKNSMMRSPSRAERLTTAKQVKAAMRMVCLRCVRSNSCVKAMKKGITPIGLTIASSAIRGLKMSMGGDSQALCRARR